MVHRANVHSALSQLASSRGSDWPSSPTCSTGTAEARDALAGHAERGGRRLDRQDPLDPVRVVGHVEPGAEADLDDPPGQARRRLGPQAGQGLGPAGQGHEPGDDLLTVEGHPVRLPIPDHVVQAGGVSGEPHVSPFLS